jgi:hypothetical protein
MNEQKSTVMTWQLKGPIRAFVLLKIHETAPFFIKKTKQKPER